MNVERTNKIVFKGSFLTDIEELQDYLDEINRDLAEKTTARILKGITLLSTFPELGKCVEENMMSDKRFLILDEFIVLYSLRDGEIHVERLLNDRQDYHRYI